VKMVKRCLSGIMADRFTQSYIPTIPIDASSFALWIHQNLHSFCTVVEQVAEGIDDLCRSDIMRTDDDFVRASLPLSL
jgi:cell cycle checkpoint protein